MSDREKCVSLLEQVPDYKISYILAYLQGLMADEEADDEFCEKLYQDYLDDPEREESFTLEECKKSWGIE